MIHTDSNGRPALAGRVYYAPHPSKDGEFIAIKEGESGYYASTVYTQDHADILNQRQGITESELEAAIMCSMFDCWRRFYQIVTKMEAA